MGWFNGLKRAKGSFLGADKRDKDAVYQDTQASRVRSGRWSPSKWFERSPVYVMVGVWIASYFLIVGLLSLLLFIFNEMVVRFSGTLLYPSLGIPFVGTAYLSGFVWCMYQWWVLIVVTGLAIFGYIKMSHWVKKTRMLHDSSHINDFENDAYVLTVPEIVAKYKAVPDKGAHFGGGVDVSAIVAHIPINNDGLEKKRMPVLEGLDGKPMGYDSGSAEKMLPVMETVEVEQGGRMVKQERVKMAYQEVIDEKDAVAQLENVGMTDERFHKLYSPKKLIVNRRKNTTLADLINKDWYFPEYETQRPSGVYLVDDAPINTMIVAMTRGNKGQCVINPTIDLWTRQDVRVNLFVNDPKGELYTAFYSTLKMRGFETVVFNLLDPDFTDQYNPLAPAIMYARKGYKDEPQKVLTNLASNFFPMPDGGEPIWTRGEQMLFNMLVLLLMDIYYEEEREYLDKYGDKLDPAQIAQDLDDMWGYVTLPNVYRMVSVLATRKFLPKNIDGTPMTDEDGNPVGESEENMLEMIFKFTMDLPTSNIRQLFSGPYSNMMAMADSEKMRSSIYGMTLTEMAFFVEGPIVALTNASPKKSFDLISMSFPRRLQFKFNEDLVRERRYVTSMVYFEFYRDPYFKDKYEGSDYEHVTRIDKLSWVDMRFAAILDQPRTYVKITLKPRGENSDVVYGTYYGEFTKGYLKSPDGRDFVRDPITHEYQIRDGVVRMGTLDAQGKFQHVPPTDRLLDGTEVHVFEMTEVAYREKPLAVFSVTPPSSLVYVKIVLMILHSMFNSTVENSYMTKANGKPLLKTKYMLDECGNLSYEGSGIDGFTTKLSIGLAQGQEYTSVFQTLQQITDVYGDTADRIIASNTGLTCFLLSSDIDMLETMSKQAGVTHVARKSLTNTVNHGILMDVVEDAVTYNTNLEEEPLFSVNRLLRMTNGEALMLSTTKRNDNDGSNSRQQPVFCTQDTSLPMAWSLHKYGYGQRSYSMLTVPTQSSSVGMGDKIPPFESIIYKRAAQAALAPKVIQKYKDKHGLSDIEYDSEMSTNPQRIGREIMKMINEVLANVTQNEDDTVDLAAASSYVPDYDEDGIDDEYNDEELEAMDDLYGSYDASETENVDRGDDSLRMTQAEVDRAVADRYNVSMTQDANGNVQLGGVEYDEDVMSSANIARSKVSQMRSKNYAGGMLSLENINTAMFKTALSRTLSVMSINTFLDVQVGDWHLEDNGHRLMRGSEVMATKQTVRQEKTVVQDDGHDVSGLSGVSLGVVKEEASSWTVTPEFLTFLRTNPDWSTIFGKKFVDQLVLFFNRPQEY